MEWILWIFFATMLGLLVYSVIGVSADFRKKFQPSIDLFFDAVSTVAFWKRVIGKRPESEPSKRN